VRREEENEKLAEAGLPEQHALVLPHTRLHALDALAWPEKVCGMGKATLKCDKPSEKPAKAFKFQVVDRKAGREVVLAPLGTSKINSS
jgi:DNA topoisomerase I